MILFIRTLVLYLLVVVVMRIMGKRQVGELQPFELVVAIIISELVATPVTNSEIPLLNGVIPMLTLVFAQLCLSYLTLKSNKARTFICGRPSILIEKGKIKEEELRRLRLNMNDLLEQLREKNFPNIGDVEFAILETNGQLSVIPKSHCRPIVIQDLGLPALNPCLPVPVVIDGRIISHNLQIVNISKEKLLHNLENEGISSLKDVLFASIDSSSNTLFWQRKEENL